MATERIIIVVSENGTDRVVQKLSGIGPAALRSGSAVRFLQGALAALGASVSMKAMVGLLDTYQTLQNRLRIVSASQNELVFSTEELFNVANRSRTSFEATVDLYTRMALSARQLGVSHADVSRAVETLNKATLISGASVREANMAMIQFSQGLASGSLKGDELRAVLEQVPYVADILGQELGVTRGALRTLGAESRITGDVMIRALLKASQEVDKQFAKTSMTVEQSVQVLRNSVMRMAADLNQRFQIIPRVTAAIIWFGENLETIGRVVLAGVLVLGITKAIAAINALTLAIAANPIGAIAVAVTATIALLVAFSDQIKLSGEGMATLADFAKAVWEELRTDVQLFTEMFADQIEWIKGIFRNLFGKDVEFSFLGLLRMGAKTIDALVGLFKGLGAAIVQIFKNIPSTIENVLVRMINIMVVRFEIFINEIIGSMNKVLVQANLSPMKFLHMNRMQMSKDAQDQGSLIGKAFMDAFTKESAAVKLLDKLKIRSEDIAAERIKREQEDKARRQREMAAGAGEFFAPLKPDERLKTPGEIALDRITRKLAMETEALKLNSHEREVAGKLMKIEEDLRRRGITLSDAERTALRSKLEENEMLKERAKVMDELTGSMAENARRQAILNDLIRKGGAYTELYASAQRKLRIAELEANRDSLSGFKAGFLSVQEEITNFAVQAEATVVNAFHSMEDALVEFVQTGKVNFSTLVDSILADLTRLLFRQTLTGLLGLGATGGAGFGLFGGGFPQMAEGGPVQPGKTYVVGERGPELFTPTAAGTIFPNVTAVGGAPPQVNVSVVNVTDPNEIASALSQPGMQDVIVNVIRRNRVAIKRVLA